MGGDTRRTDAHGAVHPQSSRSEPAPGPVRHLPRLEPWLPRLSRSLRRNMERGSLLARREELAQKKRQLQERIRGMRQQRRDARPWSRARAEYENAFVVEVGCAIWCQSQSREHVLAYANRHPGRGVAPAEALLQKCEAMPAAEVTERLGATGGRRLRALESARRFLHGAAMHGWVVQQNRCKGLAPTMEAVWRYGQQAVRSGEPVAPAGPQRGASRPLRPHSRFNALRRWRRRFDIRLGRFPMGAAEPPSALREKAAGPGRTSFFFDKFCEAILGFFFLGSGIRDHFRGRV